MNYRRHPRVSTSTVATTPVTTVAPLSSAEASVQLCAQIEYADEAVVAGNFLAGGLRLASGISSYGDTADSALVASARTMIAAGKAGDADGYVAARAQASAHCTRLGRPIATGGVQCITFPCP